MTVAADATTLQTDLATLVSDAQTLITNNATELATFGGSANDATRLSFAQTDADARAILATLCVLQQTVIAFTLKLVDFT